MHETLKDIEVKSDESYLTQNRDFLDESLTTKVIDHTRIKDTLEKAREYRLVPEYVEEFFKRAFEKVGGRFRDLKGGFIAIDFIPYELKEIAEEVSFKNRYGQLRKRYSKATFDKDRAFRNPDAEFISFGHPLLEALIEWVIRSFKEVVKKGSLFKDLSGRLDGYLWFYTGEVRDGKGEVAGRRVIALYDNGSEIREVNPTILWDLAPCKEHIHHNTDVLDKGKILASVVDAVERYREEVLKDREREAEIKTKYGIESLKFSIRKLDEELAELYDRQARGEKVELPIKNKEDQKRKYEKALKELEKEIELEKSLIMSQPELITVIRVIPESGGMSEDEEIERIGMEIAMEYERRNGREPEDVSKENLGFDIRSKGKGETRYIEVKARSSEGEVMLTPNEWMMAKRFGKDYWLYVILNATTKPVLYVINDPVKNLNAIKKVEVKFVVPVDEIKEGKEEVWSR